MKDSRIKEQLKQELERCNRDRQNALEALAAVCTHGAEPVGEFTLDGEHVRVSAVNLTRAHGGLLAMRDAEDARRLQATAQATATTPDHDPQEAHAEAFGA